MLTFGGDSSGSIPNRTETEFDGIIEALSFWEKKIISFLDASGGSADVEDFVAWAISERCPPSFAYTVLNGGEDFDPVLAFDALKAICIANIGPSEAEKFFNERLKMPINADDRLKRYAFTPEKDRVTLDYYEAVGAKTVRCCIMSDTYGVCHKHDQMVFTISDARKFEELKCAECSLKWELPYNDTPPSSIDDAILASRMWVSELYDRASSFLACGKFTPEDCDKIVELYNSAYCPPYGEALKFRGIGEALMAKGNLLGAIESFETALLWDEHVGVKKKLKALYLKTGVQPPVESFLVRPKEKPKRQQKAEKEYPIIEIGPGPVRPIAPDDDLGHFDGYFLLDCIAKTAEAGASPDFIISLYEAAEQKRVSPNTKAKICKSLGELLADVGETERAITTLKRALEYNPKAPVKRLIAKLEKDC